MTLTPLVEILEQTLYTRKNTINTACQGTSQLIILPGRVQYLSQGLDESNK
jgi:hypothetical protein